MCMSPRFARTAVGGSPSERRPEAGRGEDRHLARVVHDEPAKLRTLAFRKTSIRFPRSTMRKADPSRPSACGCRVLPSVGSRSTAPALPFRQQQLPRLLKTPFEAACDETEDTGQLNLHRHCGVKHIDG